MLDESLIETLGSYDGKHVAPFRAIADELAIRPDGLEVAISIVDSHAPHARIGGTWILKRLLELGLESNSTLSGLIVKWLGECSEKDVRLHLLQILHLIQIPKASHNRLYKIACEFTDDKNTLVRAWAYNVLGLIAHRNSKYKTEILERFQEAMENESPSVKARIRNSKLWDAKRD